MAESSWNDEHDSEVDGSDDEQSTDAARVLLKPSEYTALVYYGIEVLLVNAWIVYKQTEVEKNPEATPEHKQFRKLVHALLQNKISRLGKKRKDNTCTPKGRKVGAQLNKKKT